MGKRYVAYVNLNLRIEYDSPEGIEARLRALDLPDIVLEKLPDLGSVIIRSRKGVPDRRGKIVRGNPRMRSKRAALARYAEIGPGGRESTPVPTWAHKEASPGPT